MATRADEMAALVDGMVSSAHMRVEAAQRRIQDEVSRAARGADDAADRAVEFTASKSSVDEFVRDLKDGRLRHEAEDHAERTHGEAERRTSTAEFMNNVSMSVAGLRVDVSDMLGSLFGSRKANADADHAARDEAERSRRDEAESTAEYRREEVAQRSADVAEELGNLADDRVLAEKLWLEGVETIHGVEGAPAVEKAQQAAAERAAAERAAAERAAAEHAAAERAASERAAAERAATERAAAEKAAAKRAASSNE